MLPYQSGKTLERDTNSLVGYVLNGFMLDRMIGKGGFSSVYAAHQIDDPGFYVAVKMLPYKLLRDNLPVRDIEIQRRYRARIDREVDSMTKLKHDNIVKIFGVEYDRHFTGIIMRYIDGTTLNAFAERFTKKQYPVGYAVALTKQMCNALQYAHSYGIIHRDVKPHNIILAYADPHLALLTDFGNVYLLDENAERLTQAGQVQATPHYAAPEQLQVDGKIGPRTDVYSLCCVLYELTTGHPPYEGPDNLTVCLAHLRNPIPFARVKNDKLSATFSAVIAKGMEKDPDLRYQNMRELRDALNPYVDDFVSESDLPTMILEQQAYEHPSRPGLIG